ncbi:hypothetical protein MG293_000932 [Ovis ammon polii]|uniref:Uncharacterized protein n=1 Tax=Ovis ammon polii TaxID=230172 RepID=A0AAD4UPH4_OVIAM|nr:hypothetical protein MG293_000932 [Ovis ammon polii]
MEEEDEERLPHLRATEHDPDPLGAVDHSPQGSSLHGDSPGKNIRIGNFKLNFSENVFSLAYIPLFIIIKKNSTSRSTDRLIKVQSRFSHVRLYATPMDYNPPSSSVHEILQPSGSITTLAGYDHQIKVMLPVENCTHRKGKAKKKEEEENQGGTLEDLERGEVEKSDFQSRRT